MPKNKKKKIVKIEFNKKKEENKKHELVYLSKEVISAHILAKAFEALDTEVELWNDLGIIEVVKDKMILDITWFDEGFEHEEDIKFIQENGLSSCFTVHITDECTDKLYDLFKQITKQFGGILCEDSEDFTPILVGQL